MKRILVFMLLLAGAVLLILGIRQVVKSLARRKREAVYQATVLSYTSVLRPGMTRKEVEDYLRARNLEFGQMCCVVPNDLQKHSWDDITKIGQEDPPWYCRDQTVFVAFQFVDGGQYKSTWGADDRDTLKAVLLYHQFGPCL